MHFLLSSLAVKINSAREVSIDDLFAKLETAGKRLKILPESQLESVLRKGGSNSNFGGITFKNEDRQQGNGWGAPSSNDSYLVRKDIIEQTKWAKNVFLDIQKALTRQGHTFSSFFSTYDGKMNIADCENRLANLGIRIDHQLSQLLKEISDEARPNVVDIRLFERAYNYHKDIYEANEINGTRLIAPVDYYQEIKSALNQLGKSFEQFFESYDLTRSGTISKETFKYLLEGELRLNMSPEVVQRIINECADFRGRISLIELREKIFPNTPINYNYKNTNTKNGLFIVFEDENARAEETLEFLKETFRKVKIDAQTVFDKLDRSRQGYIDIDDFTRIINFCD